MGFNGTNGAQGPQGPRGFNGTNGVNGTQGPPGISFMNNTNTYTNTYTRVASSTNLAITTPPFYTQSFPTCDPGDLAISGGFIAPLQALPKSLHLMQFPLRIFKAQTHGVVLKSPTNFQPFNAKVLCFYNP